MATTPRGQGHGTCDARKRQGEGQCRRPAGWGTDHAGTGRCKLHGGSTRNLRAAALTERARTELARLDVPPVDDPLTELSRLAGQVVAWKDALADKVNQLTSIRYEDAKMAEQLRSEVALFERALDRCNTVLVSIAKLGIDERLARISELQADIVVRAIDAALRAAGLSGEPLSVAKGVAGRHLRAVN